MSSSSGAKSFSREHLTVAAKIGDLPSLATAKAATAHSPPAKYPNLSYLLRHHLPPIPPPPPPAPAIFAQSMLHMWSYTTVPTSQYHIYAGMVVINDKHCMGCPLKDVFSKIIY